jgi:hypothetical protein
MSYLTFPPLTITSLQCSETPGVHYPVIWRHIPDEINLQMKLELYQTKVNELAVSSGGLGVHSIQTHNASPVLTIGCGMRIPQLSPLMSESFEKEWIDRVAAHARELRPTTPTKSPLSPTQQRRCFASRNSFFSLSVFPHGCTKKMTPSVFLL